VFSGLLVGVLDRSRAVCDNVAAAVRSDSKVSTQRYNTASQQLQYAQVSFAHYCGCSSSSGGGGSSSSSSCSNSA